MAGTVVNTTSSTSTTKTYISGTASGLDTEALINNAYQVKTEPAVKLEAKITKNNEKIDIYNQVNTYLDNLLDSIEDLKTPDSSFGSNVFDSKQASFSGNTENASSILAVDATSGAQNGTYSIEVVSTAKAMKVKSASIQAASTDALSYNSVFEIGISGGGTAQIEITEDMNIYNIADNINDISATTGVTASVLKVSENEYQLYLTAKDTNKTITASSISGDDFLTSIGIKDSEGDFQFIQQQPEGAKILFDGTEISSDDNVFDNVLSGVTVTVYASSEGKAIETTVEPDYTKVKNAIQSFIDAYNELKDYLNNIQNETTYNEDTDKNEYNILRNDSSFRDINNKMLDIISSLFTTSKGNVGLANIGITLDDDGKLQIENTTTLDSAILNNMSLIQGLFETNFSSSSVDLVLFGNDSTISSFDFSMDIKTDGSGNIVAASINGDSSLFTISGSLIKGAAGTKYEGLEFIYLGDSDKKVNVKINQGLAGAINNIMEPYANDITGSILKEINRLETTNDNLQSDIDDIYSNADDYKERLIEKYSKMEANVAAAETLRKQIAAVLGSDDDD